MDYCLVVYDHDDAPSYVALSYTWGEESATEFVNVDGKAFAVRPNLFRFLETYRTDEYLWIDQICIDQSNAQEQSQQVQSMGKVYDRCDSMLIWLRDDKTYALSTSQAALAFNRGVDFCPNNDSGEGDPSGSKTTWSRPTLALFHNPYFDRLWIVQELILARNIRVLVEGDTWISWEALRKQHEQLGDEARTLIPSTSWMLEAHFNRNLFASYTPKSLSYFITINVNKFSRKKCKNPQDKIYGFMALIAPSLRLKVDYEKPVQDVYLDAIMAMIKEYWIMKRDTPAYGYELIRYPWELKMGRLASWDLAQAMGSTDLEKLGLKSFVEGVWDKVHQYEGTARTLMQEVDPDSHCIASVGFEPAIHQPSRDELFDPVCDRWWYEFDGRRYYHDCKEWSGDWRLQEYPESLAGRCLYAPQLR